MVENNLGTDLAVDADPMLHMTKKEVEQQPPVNGLQLPEMATEVNLNSSIRYDEDSVKSLLDISAAKDQIHTPEQKNRATASDVAQYVDDSISKSVFVKDAILSDEVKPNLSLGAVSEDLVQKIATEYGVDISGYTHVLNDNDLRHIYNRHGPHTKEKYPITTEDLKQIPNIIDQADNVYYVSRKDGKSGIYYEKRHNGITYYLEAISTGEGILQNKQMFKVGTGDIPRIKGLAEEVQKKRSNSPAPDDAANAVPQMYVQDVKENASNKGAGQVPDTKAPGSTAKTALTSTPSSFMLPQEALPVKGIEKEGAGQVPDAKAPGLTAKTVLTSTPSSFMLPQEALPVKGIKKEEGGQVLNMPKNDPQFTSETPLASTSSSFMLPQEPGRVKQKRKEKAGQVLNMSENGPEFTPIRSLDTYVSSLPQKIQTANNRAVRKALDDGVITLEQLSLTEQRIRKSGLEPIYHYESKKPIDGFLYGNEVHINLASPRASYFVALEETAHAMTRENPQEFASFVESVKELINEIPELRQRANRLAEAYLDKSGLARNYIYRTDGSLNRQALDEEVVLGLVEDIIRDPEHLEALISQKRGWIQAFLDFIKGVLNRIDANIFHHEAALYREAERRLVNALRGQADTASERGHRVYSFQAKKVTPPTPEFQQNISQTNLVKMKKGPDYQAAKAGDKEAAKRHIQWLVDNGAIKENRIEQVLTGLNNPLLVAPHQERESNQIGVAFAEYLANHYLTGQQSLDHAIHQVGRANHTSKDAAQRLNSRVSFEGKVEPGREYVLVDDVFTSGGTLYDLRLYIDEHDGKTMGSLTLAEGSGTPTMRYKSNQFAIRPETLRNLYETYGGKEVLDELLRRDGLYWGAEELTDRQGMIFASQLWLKDRPHWLAAKKAADALRESQSKVSKERSEASYSLQPLNNDTEKNYDLPYMKNLLLVMGLYLPRKGWKTDYCT